MKSITIIIPASENSLIEGEESIKQQDLNFIIVRGNNPSKNRNEGIKKAKTKFIAFINAHTILSDNWGKSVKNFFLNHPNIDIVGGPQHTDINEGVFAYASGIALGSIFGSANISTRYTSRNLDLDADETKVTSANLICKKEVFRKVIFDETIYPGEDPKFIADTKKVGLKVAYSPEIVVFNRRRKSIFNLAKQVFNYGVVRPKKESLKETIKRPYFLIPSLFILYIISLSFILQFSFFALLPLFLYIALNIFFSAYESLKNKKGALILLLPFIFTTIHISYGAGFIVGLIKNGIRRKK